MRAEAKVYAEAAPTGSALCRLQLWAANNRKRIHVDFTRMVYDKESDLVLIDLLEYCRCARRCNCIRLI